MSQPLPENTQKSLLDILYSEKDPNVSWTEFTKKTTFHGVKYIFSDSTIKLRKPLWVTVVLASIIFFLIQVGIRTRDYWKYETSIGESVTYMAILEFPAITICNQNSYRITATVGLGLYDVIDEVFQTRNASEIDWGSFVTEIDEIDVKRFTLSTGHQKLLFIDSCTWNGADCNIDMDFKTVLTDLGVCYTFNGGGNKSGIQTTQSGAGSGLKLVINVEQYEYMRGPQNDAGIKVLLHPRDEVAMMKDQGFAAAPGIHTFVAMKRYETNWLEPPYGNCVPENPPISQCLHVCEAHDVIRECGCHAVYMKEMDNNSTAQCGLKSSLFCIRESVDQRRSQDCHCISPPCHQVTFDSELSYAQLSKLNIERMILDKPEKQQTLQTNYLNAREVEQRNRKDIVAKDKHIMTSSLKIGYDYKNTMGNFEHGSPILSNGVIDKEIITQDMLAIFTEIIDNMFKAKLIVAPMNTFYIAMTSLQTDFLECNGSQSLFYNNLMMCVEKISVDGSGALPMDQIDLSQMDPRLSMVMMCLNETGRKERIDDMRDFYAKTPFNETFDPYQNELQQYLEIVYSFIRNKSMLAQNPAHIACQLVLESEHQLRELDKGINYLMLTLVSAGILEQLIGATKAAADLVCGADVQSALMGLPACSWIKLAVWTHFSNMYSTFFKATEVNAGFLESKQKMQTTLTAMANKYDLFIMPIWGRISAYLNGTMTKATLAEYMGSSQTEIALGILASFYTDSYNAINVIQNIVKPFHERIIAMYQNLAYQGHIDVRSLGLIQVVMATNRSDFMALVDGLQDDIYTNLQRIMDLIMSEFNMGIKVIEDTIPGPSENVLNSLIGLQKELLQYTESIQMDVGFFLENFLQVDIFYQDMSYESSTQLASFTLASLFGEVGGFMGLLLGASIMTISELIDYIIVGIVEGCRRHRKVKPSSTIINVRPAQ